MDTKNKKVDFTVTIPNLDVADTMALYELFEQMRYLGSAGSSRTVAFYADGDGRFRPQPEYKFNDSEIDDLFKKLKGKLGSWDRCKINGSEMFHIDSDEFYSYTNMHSEQREVIHEDHWPAIDRGRQLHWKCPVCKPIEQSMSPKGNALICSQCNYSETC